MSLLQLRKLVIQIEETHTEMGRPVDPASRKVTVAAVIANPYAGRYVDDLSPLYALGAEVAQLLAERGVAALNVAPDEVTSYGKGAIVGTAGEIEHAAALLIGLAWVLQAGGYLTGEDGAGADTLRGDTVYLGPALVSDEATIDRIVATLAASVEAVLPR